MKRLRPDEYKVVLHHLGDEVVYLHDPVKADQLRTADVVAMSEEEMVAHRDQCIHPGDIIEADGTIISSTPRPTCCQRVEAPHPTTYDYGETWTCQNCGRPWYVARGYSSLAMSRIPTWKEVRSLSFLVMLKDVSRRKRYRI